MTTHIIATDFIIRDVVLVVLMLSSWEEQIIFIEISLSLETVQFVQVWGVIIIFCGIIIIFMLFLIAITLVPIFIF